MSENQNQSDHACHAQHYGVDFDWLKPRMTHVNFLASVCKNEARG